ncbi:hypothetical protein A8V01_24870 [Novosphingobium guangzhouense]|uniref:Uncharacterized protein n=1 Tax=Novosphingobium guangzhouense TaxID=1850347 RepID=A0A2K2FWH6_9SPHN|nr:hypothetical protein A8V01_24870 [Novosphingobium guangzhouense]
MTNAALDALAKGRRDALDAGGVGEDVIERISQRIAVFADMKPEEDEEWESWYHAAFDMLSAEVAALADSETKANPVVDSGGWGGERQAVLALLRGDIECVQWPRGDADLQDMLDAVAHAIEPGDHRAGQSGE